MEETGLLGIWVSDPTDIKGLEEFGPVSMEFKPDGHLTYTIHEPSRMRVILMTYRVLDDVLITDQPSTPREERTRFFVTPDGKLQLGFGEDASTFVRRDGA